MSEYFNKNLSALKPYTPGEQPQDMRYIKLNTNENPYFPSKYAVDGVTRSEVENLRLYSDPTCGGVAGAVADFYGIEKDNVLVTNGSDEALAFCFAAFGENGAAFPDVTYGFYKVFASLFNVKYKEIPLNDDFTIDITPYLNYKSTVIIANPNAQTGIYMPLNEVERLIASDKNRVVIVDEAYIDFGGESAAKLIKKYNNLVVVQTFSKSRSLAGARVGFAMACKELIVDLNRVKFSFNPYNVNRLSLLLAEKAMRDTEYFNECVHRIICSRERLVTLLNGLDFSTLPSSANFVMTKSKNIGGERLYLQLKSRGVLVRHFSDERIKDFVRITVGTDDQTDILIEKIKEILNL